LSLEKERESPSLSDEYSEDGEYSEIVEVSLVEVEVELNGVALLLSAQPNPISRINTHPRTNHTKARIPPPKNSA